MRASASKYLRWFGALALALAPLLASSAPAHASESGGFSTEVLGPVQANGGHWYWRLKIQSNQPFAGSWETLGAPFGNSADLKSAIDSISSCQSQVVQSYLASFASQTDLLDLGAEAQTEVQGLMLDQCQKSAGWQPKMSGYFDAYGDWVALIPFSQLAVGNHKLFAMQASSKGSSTRDACRRVWPDRSWSGFDCEYSIGETFTFSVAVPSHGTNSPKLDGPPAAAQSFFDKSTFSGLKPIEPTKVASQVASGSGLAGVLTVLVAFPTLFLSKALDDIHGKLARKNRLGWMDKTVTGMWAMAMFFLAAILGGFSDPNFGINLESLRVLITGFLGFVLMDFGRNLIVFWATKKDSRQEYPQLSARPFFLLVILGTVVIARLSAIDPAMVFGSVIAIELGAAIEEHTKGKVKLYTLLYTFLLGIAAWVGYSYLTNLHLASLPGLANIQSGNFLIWLQMCQVSLGEFLSMVAVSSFSTIPITLLPFANLGGKPLLDWRRWVWVLMYFVGILGYTVVVLPMPRSWAKPSEPFSVWMGILAIYTVVALTLFVGITARNRKLERLAKLYPGR